MIDNIVKRIKKDNEFNNQGYKITSLEVRVNEVEQKYYITLLKEKDYNEYNFLCKDINSLYNLLHNYGMED